MIRKKYNSKFNFKKNTEQKKEIPNLKIDFVGVVDKEKNLGQSLTYGKIQFPKNKNFKKGWHIVDPTQIINKAIKDDATLLHIGKAPLRGIKKFLSDWYFKGIGEVLADKIVEEAKMTTLTLIRGNTSNLKERFQLNDEQTKTLHNGWQKNKDTAYYEILLNELGFTNTQKQRLKDNYGILLIKVLATNPISLLGAIPLLSFSDIERICERLNFEISDEQKAIAVTKHVLNKKETSDGHTCYPLEGIIPEVLKLSELEKDFIIKTIKQPSSGFKFIEKNSKEIIQSDDSNLRDKKIVQEINRIIKTFTRGKNKKTFIKSELKVQKNVDLSDEQIDAVNAAINNPISIITGGPGAGKTTMVKALVSAITKLKLKLKLTAPTGKAATRIAAEGLMQFKPSTIHSYLGPFEEKSKEEFDIMIVDESSMIDIELMRSLLVSIPDKASIVFIGDADQLPPVGPGQVFKDLIKSQKITVAKLTGNYRQDTMSGIAKSAREIVKGKIPTLIDELNEDVIFKNLPIGKQADEIITLYFETLPSLGIKQEDIQILTPQREGEVGIYNLNRLIQQKLTARGTPLFTNKMKSKNSDFEMSFFSGDKVIMRKNKVKELGLVNGDIGRVLRKSGSTVFIEFNEKEIEFSVKDTFDLQLAYAITIHLSQGSDYKGVIITCSSEHRYMLRRNLIYTALTRAKDKAVFVGEKSSFSEGVEKIPVLRYTNLIDIIKEDLKDD